MSINWLFSCHWLDSRILCFSWGKLFDVLTNWWLVLLCILNSLCVYIFYIVWFMWLFCKLSNCAFLYLPLLARQFFTLYLPELCFKNVIVVSWSPWIMMKSRCFKWGIYHFNIYNCLYNLPLLARGRNWWVGDCDNYLFMIEIELLCKYP